MKKLLAAVFAAIMVLSLGACDDEPEDTEPTQKVQLATVYKSSSGTLARYAGGEYTMEFSYNEDYTAGNVALRYINQLEIGRFTCDENYNINSITVSIGQKQFRMDMTFDDQHQMLTCRVCRTDQDEEQELSFLERRYDNYGRIVYNEQTQGNAHSVWQKEYDGEGRLLSQYQDFRGSGISSFSHQVFVYNEDGCMTAIESYNAEGALLRSTPVTWEKTAEGILHTYPEEENTIKLLQDQKGKTLKKEVYSGDKLISTTVHTYDDAGRELGSEQRIASTGHIIRWEYAWLSDGRQTVMRRYAGSTLEVYIETTYLAVTP